MSDQQQTLSIPSLILFAALSALAIRYFFFSPSRAGSSAANSTNRRGVNLADVEQIAQMFPQIARRDIMWDLQRNGGSVAATTERILSRGSLDTPPPTFQPVIPTTTNNNSARAPFAQKPPEQIDLIKRYGLTEKVSSPFLSSSAENSSSDQQGGWSNNKNERQALLQRRREEMILNARRKLEERQRAGASS